MNDFRVLHGSALRLADEHVSGVGPSELSRATPCAGWSLADLLAHMIGQQYGFARAMREHDTPVEAYRPVPFDLATWRASVAELESSFADADLDAVAVAIEIAPTELPIRELVAAQLLDTVVHTWDIGQAVGVEFTPPADLLAATAAIAAAIPDRAFGPGRAFAERLPTSGTTWQNTLALVGRRTAATVTTSKD
jgi:uncharacterized protein (TIGR03086 family)